MMIERCCKVRLRSPGQKRAVIDVIVFSSLFAMDEFKCTASRALNRDIRLKVMIWDKIIEQK